MPITTQSFDLNIVPGSVPVVVHVSQYDHDSREFIFKLHDNTGVFHAPAHSAATISGTKRDGTGFNLPITLEDDTARFVLDAQLTIFFGRLDTKITITDENGGKLGTGFVCFEVDPAALKDDVPVSETDLPLLQRAVDGAEYVAANIENIHRASVAVEMVPVLEADIRQVEGLISDTRGLVNDAQRYSDSSAASATNADNSAQAAEKAYRDTESLVVTLPNLIVLHNADYLLLTPEEKMDPSKFYFIDDIDEYKPDEDIDLGEIDFGDAPHL